MKTALPTAKKNSHLAHHLCLMFGLSITKDVPLDGLVRKLVGIQLRAVGNQKEQPEIVLVIDQPLFSLLRFIYRMPVNNEEHFSTFKLLHYTTQEF